MVLASGQRCGSTLIQRLLNSHQDVLLWGEHGGLLGSLFSLKERLDGWDDTLADQAREEFAARAYDGWIANLLPGRDAIEGATRSYLLELFARPVLQLGRSRWGFKEVRYGVSMARAMRELFPRTCVVHVTRDPREVLRSLDWWERCGKITRQGTGDAIRNWCKVNEELLPLRSASWVLSVRYEDVVADPAAFTNRLSKFVGLQTDDFDTSVFDHRIHSDGPEGRMSRRLTRFTDLDPALRRLIADPELLEIACAYGYRLDDGGVREVPSSRFRVMPRRVGRLAKGRIGRVA